MGLPPHIASALASALGVPDLPPVRLPVLNHLISTLRFPRRQVTVRFIANAPEAGDSCERQGQFAFSLGSLENLDALVGLVNKLREDWGLDLLALFQQSHQMALATTGFGQRR